MNTEFKSKILDWTEIMSLHKDDPFLVQSGTRPPPDTPTFFFFFLHLLMFFYLPAWSWPSKHLISNKFPCECHFCPSIKMLLQRVIKSPFEVQSSGVSVIHHEQLALLSASSRGFSRMTIRAWCSHDYHLRVRYGRTSYTSACEDVIVKSNLSVINDYNFYLIKNVISYFLSF